MRLYRPHIPVAVKCRVAMAALGELWPDDRLAETEGRHGELLKLLLQQLAFIIACKVEDLRLDHDPPLALRPKFYIGLSRKVRYEPDANDPEYLRYRSHANHDIKTRVRGDGAQFCDLALIRRQKKRDKPPKPKRAWPSRPFPKRSKA